MKRLAILLPLCILLFAGCATLKPLEPVQREAGDSILYVFREDSATSMGHKVSVYLNDTKATDILEYDGYYGLVVKPGQYTIKFECFNKAGELIKEKGFTGMIEPNSENMTSVAYNFGWRGFNKFFSAEGKSVMMRFKYQGQIDLTDTISPQ